MIVKTLLIASLVFVATVAVDDAAVLKFSGRNLPSFDIFGGSSDAFINVYYASSSSSQYRSIGTTDYISNYDNPDWPDAFIIPNNGETTQMLKIDMYDADSPNSDDYMGSVEFPYSDILNDSNGFLTKNLVGGEGGQLVIKRI